MNLKKQITTGAFILFAATAFAQEINKEQLNQIQNSFVKDQNTIALQNLLSNDKDIKNKTLNRDLQGKIDHHFKYKVDVSGITDQKSSGRCWMFTSMNQLRPDIMKQFDISSFDFSHNYN